MEIYVDESGQTGPILIKNSRFNFGNQRYFCLCLCIVKNKKDKEKLLKKYKWFRKKFELSGEFKGSDLMTKKYNKELNYFIEHVLDKKHFMFCVYDKFFLLCSLMMELILGQIFQKELPVQYYIFISEIVTNDIDILYKFVELELTPTKEKFKDFLIYLSNYNYKTKKKIADEFINAVKALLENENYELFVDEIMTKGWYKNKNYINLINLNSLSEMILTLKIRKNLNNKQFNIIHDNIDGIEDTILDELKGTNIQINFEESKNNDFIQISDMAVGIFRKAVSQVLDNFEKKELFLNENMWITSILNQVVNKVDIKNIKFDIAINHWAGLLAVCECYGNDDIKSEKLSNLFRINYNFFYERILDNIADNINYFDLEKAMRILSR